MGFSLGFFIFAFCLLGRKNLAGTAQQTHFLLLIRFSVSGYYQNVQCLGGKYLWGKRRLQHSQVNLSWDKLKAI